MCTDHIGEIILEETRVPYRVRNNTLIDILGALICDNIHEGVLSLNNVVALFHEIEYH